jgi:hypothetical protein
VAQKRCSRRLQRVVTEFGADVPFAQVADKLVEHYGVPLGESTIRRVTLSHAKKIHARSHGAPQGLPKAVPAASIFVVETDGTMIPTVKSDPDAPDKRKGKSVQWQEAKISLAHVKGSKELVYAGTLKGDVDEVGKQLRKCAKRAGFGVGHRAHGVGDGAPWIAKQMKKRFGSQGSYLVDFYHVCEYLSAAAQGIEAQPAAQKAWVDEQKQRLKTSRVDAVIQALHAHLEPQDQADEASPVRRCHRYLLARLDQLDYEGALREDLPIGSGEIESAHRHVVQKRLKLPGAWWEAANAEHMLSLRLCRANKEWSNYWATDLRYVA